MLQRIVFLIEDSRNHGRDFELFRELNQAQCRQNYNMQSETDEASQEQRSRNAARLDLHLKDFWLRCVGTHERLLWFRIR